MVTFRGCFQLLDEKGGSIFSNLDGAEGELLRTRRKHLLPENIRSRVKSSGSELDSLG